MIKKLIIRSSVLLLFGIIESILAVQNMELVEFCKTTALITYLFNCNSLYRILIMVNDTLIKGIQCHLRDALNMINNIKLSDVSSIEEMGELVELRKEFQPLHDKFNKFLIK